MWREIMAEGSTQKQKARLSLQQYTKFYDGNARLDLSIDQLNQIISIHGFNRFHQRNKTEVIAALELMDLVNPRRSTLDRSVSNGEPLTLEEVRADLESMDWQCCRLVSLKSFEYGLRRSSSATVVPLTSDEKQNVGVLREDVGSSNPGGDGGSRVLKRRRGRPPSANKKMKIRDLDRCDLPSLTFRQ